MVIRHFKTNTSNAPRTGLCVVRAIRNYFRCRSSSSGLVFVRCDASTLLLPSYDSVIELAKVSRLLMTVDDGDSARYYGTHLGDINVNGNKFNFKQFLKWGVYL